MGPMGLFWFMDQIGQMVSIRYKLPSDMIANNKEQRQQNQSPHYHALLTDFHAEPWLGYNNLLNNDNTSKSF